MTKPAEYYFKEGCYIQEWHNHESDKDLSVARVRVEAHSETRLHCLSETVERYIVLRGKGEATVADQVTALSEGDVLVIPANTPQKIRNTQDYDLVFLAVCQPRFEERNYIDLEEN